MSSKNNVHRAPAGGAFGANGEWYEGGKFINTVPTNAKGLGRGLRGTKRQEIEPGVWASPPQAGIMSLYTRMRAFVRVDDGIATPCELKQVTLDYYGITKPMVQTWAEQYNAGQRWLDPTSQR